MTCKPFPGLVGAAMLMIATQALAQDAPGRVLKKTNLRATTIISGIQTVGTSYVHLLTPTVITCPGSSTCTLHIEVSSTFSGLDAGADMRMKVLVDNSEANPGNALFPIVVATNDGAAETGENSKTFQFMQTGVTPGNHTVEWLARVRSGTAVTVNRIQKINIYIP